MSAWGLQSWLGLVRCIQLLATVAAGGLQAFLVIYISRQQLGLTQNMVTIQSMLAASVVFVATTFAIIHTGNRSTRTTYLVASIMGDLSFIGIDLAMITVLASAGLPSHCAGLTKDASRCTAYSKRTPIMPPKGTFKQSESEYDSSCLASDRDPESGYTSLVFTNGYNGAKGELDKYCALERGIYVIVLALVFAFMASIILTILRICQGSFTKNSKVSDQMVTALHEEEKMKSQGASPTSISVPRTPPVATGAQVPPPPREGILSPHASMRQPVPLGMSVPINNAVAGSSSSSSGPLTTTAGSSRSPHHAGMMMLTPSTSYVASSSSSSAAAATRPMVAPGFGGYNSTPEEDAAAAALITDGSGYHTGSVPGGLPPYTPGHLHPMAGHGDESNEIRLSDYVKGETRAQNMKDGLQ